MLYKLILKDGSEVFAEMSEDAKDNIVKYLDGIKNYTLLEDVTIFTIKKKRLSIRKFLPLKKLKFQLKIGFLN